MQIHCGRIAGSNLSVWDSALLLGPAVHHAVIYSGILKCHMSKRHRMWLECVVNAGRCVLFLQQHAHFHFPSLAVHKASFAWVVNRQLQGGSREICRVFFFFILFSFWFLNLLSNYESDITAAETHDNDFDGRVLERPRPRCSTGSILCSLTGAICLTNACQALRPERVPRAHLISPKATWVLSSLMLSHSVHVFTIKDATAAPSLLSAETFVNNLGWRGKNCTFSF